MTGESLNPLEKNFLPFPYEILRFNYCFKINFSSNNEDHNIKRKLKKCSGEIKLRDQEPC